MKSFRNVKIENNFRDLQDLNDRIVYYSSSNHVSNKNYSNKFKFILCFFIVFLALF